MSRALALYWVNDQKDTAVKYYKELISKYPKFTLDTLRKIHDVWSPSKVTKDLIENAFQEVKQAAMN